MSYQYIQLEEPIPQIQLLKINRPNALNALNAQVLTEIENCVDNLEKTSTRILIVTGEGKAFVAGADISEMKGLNSKEAKEFSQKGQKVFNKLDLSPIVSIAAINGFALGGGLELALACDIRIATATAKIGLPEVSLGLIPGFGGTQRLTRLIGTGLALELILTGGMFNAEEGLRMGILNKVVEPEQLLPTALEIARSILSRGRLAVQRAKITAKKGFDFTLGNGLEMEAEEFGNLFDGAESKEGMSAFLEKRKPNFS